MNRLMLGAGKTRRDGWTKLDANPKNEPDIVAVLPPLPAEIQAMAWDEIEWVHGITSFYPWDAFTLLQEIHSILTPEGKLTLEQPDFGKAKERIEWLFGDPISGNPLHMNRWAYTPNTLSALLRLVGFSHIEVWPAEHHLPWRDFRIEAYR